MGGKRERHESEGSLPDDIEEDDEDVLQTLTAQQREVTGEPMKKMTKKEREKLYKEPTVEELNQMKETENLFHSNLFRLQITEVLKEVSLKEKHKRQAEKLISTLKETILDIPASEQYDLKDTKWLTKQKVKLPIHQASSCMKGKFQFLPPLSVRIIGSYLLDTVVKPDTVVDLMVEMPKACVSENDSQNHRYLRKRALYLACIATHLNKDSQCEHLRFTYLHGNHLKPILVVTLKGDSRPITVHIHVVMSSDAFNPELFNINKCNVNTKWWKDVTQLEDKDDVVLKPTPISNMAVLEDLTLQQNTDHLEKTLTDLSGFTEGIKLLKIWLRQRELDKGYGYFNSYIMTMYVVYLLSQRLLNKMMSSYQVFRSTLIQLARSDWLSKPPSLYRNKKSGTDTREKDMMSVFDVVFLDTTGLVNICSTLNKSLFQRVIHEAKLSADYLTGKTSEAFDLLLMTPVTFDRKFDYCFHIENIRPMVEKGEELGGIHKMVDNGGHYLHAYLPAVLNILQKALDKRIYLIQSRACPTPQWDINEEVRTCDGIERVTIGILVDTLVSVRAVEKGPAADSPQARGFREFWGEVSELRRFQDGSICEAIVWSKGSSYRKKRLVSSKIVPYILKKYAGIDIDDIRFIGEEFDIPLHLPFPKQPDLPVYGTGEEQHAVLLQTYDSLRKSLRALPDLPLRINTIQGIHPVFRFTDVFPVMALNQFKETKKIGDKYFPTRSQSAPPFHPVLPVMCVLEGSGKWPDNIDAIKRLKAAIYIQISKGLSTDKNLKVYLHATYIDIMKDGYVFRITISALRELSILKSTTSKSGMLRVQTTDQSMEFEKTVIALPKLTSTIHGIYQQHNTVSCAVRLAKRWVSAQLLSDHIPELAIELIVCHIYLTPAPYTKPGSPGAGFLRFLQLLSTFDWKNTPLLINLNTEFTAEDFIDIPARFQKEREKFPLMFLSTPYDRWSSYWTTEKPTAMILSRLAVLAKESLTLLQDQVLNPSAEDDIKQVFRPPLESYDALIHLNTSLLPRSYQAIDNPRDKLVPDVKDADDKTFPLIDYDTCQLYLHELREIYDDVALFFYDQFGGSCIGVLWRPNVFHKKDVKVPNLCKSKPSTRGDDVVLECNIDAIIEDFKILGEQLVKSIDVRRR
ncbi:nucleolar protein 6 [Patella vulgata]|uniref:nucleolar protein 6 n=1 Tax=Patella vulgata TaxID=6465 RepID=UPI00217F9C80|nr:nucleolar protein 6 [Patella vulgata]